MQVSTSELLAICTALRDETAASGNPPSMLMTTPFYPPAGGGLERYAQAIGRQLSERHGWRIFVVTTGERGRADTCEREGAITVIRLGYRYRIGNVTYDPRWRSLIRKIVDRLDPDIVNVHMPVPGLADVAGRQARRRPLVVTYHASSMKKGSWLAHLLVRAYETVLLPRLLRRADRIICSSDYVRDFFLAKWRQRSITITPGVDIDRFHPAPERPDAFRALFVGGLGQTDEHKGLRYLLRALARTPGVQLLVVGDGDRREDYAEYARSLGLKDRIEFAGRLAGDDLVSAFHRSSVLVHPTLNDSFAMVIVEAMSAELPVIATRTGGIPSLVDDGVTGWLVQPKDEAAISKRLSWLVARADHGRSFGSAGRATVVGRLSWEDQGELTARALLPLVGQPAKIVQVIAHYPPYLGGMEQLVQELSVLLADSGRNVQVITSSIGRGHAGVEHHGLVEVDSLRAIEFAHTPVMPGLLPKLLRIRRGSLIHLHLSQAFVPETVLLASWLKRLPYIVHVHGIVQPSGSLGFILPVYQRLVLPRLLRRARRVIVPTSDYRDRLTDEFGLPPGKITVIPNATTFSRSLAPRNHPHSKTRLLSVGRLSAQKNYSLLIEAAALLVQQGLQFELSIVGEGEERPRLEELIARRKLTGVVKLEGAIWGPELEECYEKADLFVLTSTAETFGRVFIEAMAKGLPIVATDIPGTRNVVVHGRNGYLAAETPEAVAGALRNLAGDIQAYADISENNLRDVENYDWRAIGEAILRLYRSA